MKLKQIIINTIKEITSWARPLNCEIPEYFGTIRDIEREVEEFYEKEVFLQSDIDAENDVYPIS